MSSICFSQTIGGIGLSKDGVEFCIGSIQDNNLYVSTDVKFPLHVNSVGYMNVGLGYKFNRNLISFKGGFYSLYKYESLRIQIGTEYLIKLRNAYIGLSYLNDQKLTIKTLLIIG